MLPNTVSLARTLQHSLAACDKCTLGCMLSSYQPVHLPVEGLGVKHADRFSQPQSGVVKCVGARNWCSTPELHDRYTKGHAQANLQGLLEVDCYMRAATSSQQAKRFPKPAHTLIKGWTSAWLTTILQSPSPARWNNKQAVADLCVLSAVLFQRHAQPNWLHCSFSKVAERTIFQPWCAANNNQVVDTY